LASCRLNSLRASESDGVSTFLAIVFLLSGYFL
jgi:hypothetical protein